MRETDGWRRAIAEFQREWDRYGEQARADASHYAAQYAGIRGLMVVDVVLSRQRRYRSRVVPDLRRWQSEVGADGQAITLAWLQNCGDALDEGLPLRSGEKRTIIACAEGLLRYAANHDLQDDEDTACASWAEDSGGLEFAPGLDPYVGSVKGIGPALFAYMRMRSGGDGIKPDVRVLERLKTAGLMVGRRDSFAALLVAPAVSHELGISLLELDQLLWREAG